MACLLHVGKGESFSSCYTVGLLYIGDGGLLHLGELCVFYILVMLDLLHLSMKRVFYILVIGGASTSW